MAAVTAAQVAAYAGDDASEAGPYGEVLPTIVNYIKGYTRGQGFAQDGTPAPDLASVITTASSREVRIRDLAGILREEVGSYSVLVSPRASDFTARELSVMNSYRRRAG